MNKIKSQTYKKCENIRDIKSHKDMYICIEIPEYQIKSAAGVKPAADQGDFVHFVANYISC